MNEEIQTFQLTSRRLTELSKSSLVTEIIFFGRREFFYPCKGKNAAFDKLICTRRRDY